MYKKVTIAKIKKLKGSKAPFATVTAYDFPSARLVDSQGIPIILVGDSAAMVVLGHDSTIPVTMEEMLMLVGAVSRGTNYALVVADMPFMSYQSSVEGAIKSAGRLLKEGAANAVKLEGGEFMYKQIEAIVNIGIPVMGHVGLTPQSVNQMSGYKIQGKSLKDAEKVYNDALAVEQAGAFSIVIEGVPVELAQIITDKLSIPTIGIAAGPHCDGQIQVYHDILGMYSKFVPAHTHQYENLSEKISDAIAEYKTDVENGNFPTDEHSRNLSSEIVSALKDILK